MGWRKGTASLVAAAMITFSLGACHKEGPAEKAGKEIDKATDHAGKAIEDMGDHVRDESKH